MNETFHSLPVPMGEKGKGCLLENESTNQKRCGQNNHLSVETRKTGFKANHHHPRCCHVARQPIINWLSMDEIIVMVGLMQAHSRRM